MPESHDVVVIGAGSAGLSISHELTRSGREHLVLDKGAVGQTWRGRWDSFTLVIPNWTVRLAGNTYDGPDPDGFMPRADFVEHITGYARSFGAPVREGVEVTALERAGGGFKIDTSAGALSAREVVVATGGYQQPFLPQALRDLPESVQLLDSTAYRNPDALPPGGVLVVGSGQTGCQLAEELVQAGREVYLACGKAPWQTRRLGDRDTFWWLSQSEFMRHTLADLPSPMARLAPLPQATGRRGGYDLHCRTLQASGVVLTGHVAGVEGGRIHFASDLADSVAFGDARFGDICGLIGRVAAELGVPMPEVPVPPPFVADPPASVDLGRISAVIACCGYRPAYASWIRHPDAFDGMGFPIQESGSSTVVPGLHFMGVLFQTSRSSSSLFGVGPDAELLAERMESAAAVG